MNTVLASRLLRKIYATSSDDSFELLRRPFRIFHMTRLPLRQLFLKNFRKSVTVSEALASTYHGWIEQMSNHAAHQDYNQAAMEPFLEAYYNSSSNCEIPLTLSSDNMQCQNDPQAAALEAESYNRIPVPPCESYLVERQRYKSMRQWKRIRKGKKASTSEEYFILKLISFNILAQNLLELYPHLYRAHNEHALPWEIRQPLLLREIIEEQANVICLQEMQEDHLEEFLIPFKQLGYDYLYKKRTHEKQDGLLFLYRTDQLVLLEHAKVELYQSGIKLLSRDNVGIIAKLAVKDSPETQLVVATTHLLYNPKRNDVRLSQTQILLAEIERIAFLEHTMTGPKYLPIVISGDFNLEPYSGVYKFITEGSFEYVGKAKTLEASAYQCLSNSLTPPRLFITDNCQHFHILTKRLRGEGTGKVMLENSENAEDKCVHNDTSNVHEVDVDNINAQVIEIMRGYQAKFSSGTLTHPFNLYSLYDHRNVRGELEATTNQGRWITVDYIFYSDLEPIEKYGLPSVAECKTLPTIPNLAVGSDHLCTGATFKVFKKKC